MHFSAAEVVAFQNTSGRKDERLPVKTLHIVPALFDARRNVALRGDRVQEIYKDWLLNASASLPFVTDKPYEVIEPVNHAGKPLADALRSTWLGKPQEITGHSRQCRASEVRITAYIGRIELARVHTLSAEQLLACGVRKTDAGWSHGDDSGTFGSAVFAFRSHWNASSPVIPWEENPWAWVLHLEPPVMHTTEQEALRVARRLLNAYRKEDAKLEKAEQALLERRASQRAVAKQVCRVLRTHCADRQMSVDDFVAHFDMEFLTRADTVPERAKEER
ncbi:hypothetical protein Q0M94_25265 (plasmid) [Deinococcus radiomollis]|uniref:hypothetical protein n=1 Tax=Deinococcus radiomollis TaxID=468916 RepID=UPI0038927E15